MFGTVPYIDSNVERMQFVSYVLMSCSISIKCSYSILKCKKKYVLGMIYFNILLFTQ